MPRLRFNSIFRPELVRSRSQAPILPLFVLPPRKLTGSDSDLKIGPYAMIETFTRRTLIFALVMGIGSACASRYGQADGSSGSGSGGSGSSNSGPGGGDDRRNNNDNDNQSGSEEARDAVEDGKAQPLSQLMAHLRKHFPGTVLDVDLRRSRNGHSYRVKLLNTNGKIQTLRLDALTLRKL
jgi:hypothetical protein